MTKSAEQYTWSQRLLGAFILAQLAFLLGGNFLPLLPHGTPDRDEITDDTTMPGRTFASPPLQQSLNLAGTAVRRYGEATGQMQGWSLFAPLVAHQGTFLVTELTWHDPAATADGLVDDCQEPTLSRSVKIASPFEPIDPSHYFHWPRSDCRRLNYEFRLTQIHWHLTDEALGRIPDFWREFTAGRVARQWKSIQAYLRFQESNYRREHPDKPPADTLTLWVRTYPVPAPGEASTSPMAPVERPLARWRRDGRFDVETQLPIEAFDPVMQQFVVLPKSAEKLRHE